MPKRPRLTPQEAEGTLLKSGFLLARTSGSHRIYVRGAVRVVIPWHAGRALHPKIVKQVFRAIEATKPRL